jgi:sigma-B regulation protein RsbU (phosphoserine phosphatase)
MKNSPTSAEIRSELNKTMRDSIGPVSLCMALVYVALGVSHLAMLTGEQSQIMTPLAFSAAAILAVQGIWVYRWPVPPEIAHPLGMVILLVSLVNCTAHLIVTDDLRHSTNFALLLIATGSLSLSTPWTLVALSMVLTTWCFASWTHDPRGDWAHFAFMLAISTTISLLLFSLRLEMRKRIELLRHHDREQQNELARINRLQAAINRVETEFIMRRNPGGLFQTFLEDLLELTDSMSGFVSECEGDTNTEFSMLARRGLTSFDGMEHVHVSFDDSLLSEGEALYSEKPVASLLGFDVLTVSDLPTHSWLTPLKLGKIRIGLVGIERYTKAYPPDLYQQLAPFLLTGANLIAANRSEQRRNNAEFALRESEERFRQVTEAAGEYVWEVDKDGRFVFVTRQITGTTGLPVDAFIGKTPFDFMHPEDADRFQLVVKQLVDKNKFFSNFTFRFCNAAGEDVWHSISGMPITGPGDAVIGFRGVGADITEQKKAERSMAEISEQLAISSQNLKQLHRLTCHTYQDVSQLYADYLATGCRVLGFDTAIISHIENGRYTMKAVVSGHADFRAELTIPLAEAYCAAVVDQRHTVSYQSAVRDASNSEPGLFRRNGLKSYIGTPIWIHGSIYGTLCFAATQERATRFRSHEIEFVELMAQSLGRAIEAREIELVRREAEAAIAQARKYELEIGSRIQETLLQGSVPRDLHGVTLAALSTPSDGIDGDFYEFFTHGNQCFDLTLGDVMGKGVPAALVGAATKSHIQKALSDLLARESHDSLPRPRDIVALVHERVVERLIAIESFITLCYARFDMDRRRLTLVDCGHTRTIHWHSATGLCTHIKGDNLPLGFSTTEEYIEVVEPFESGDVFVFYSDGLTDAQNADGEHFGIERLTRLVAGSGRCMPEQIVNTAREAVSAFAGPGLGRDDLTCMAIAIRSAWDSQSPIYSDILEFRSDLGQLANVREFVRKSCCASPAGPLPENVVDALELAAQEATSNIIRHAYSGRQDRKIRIVMEIMPDFARVQLGHSGEDFNPNSVPEPSFDGSREGGFGLYIIRNVMDHVDFLQNDSGESILSLVKYIRPPQGHRETTWTSKHQS